MSQKKMLLLVFIAYKNETLQYAKHVISFTLLHYCGTNCLPTETLKKQNNLLCILCTSSSQVCRRISCP
jgi:hypothetical protein